MGFAVFHAEKVTTSGASLGYHIDRTPGQEHSFRSADPERLKLNTSFHLNEYCKMPLNEAIDKRIQEGYKGNTAIRKDAVKGLSLLFSGTHEDMKAIEKNPDRMKQWLKANYDFVSKEFGKENIVRFVLHRDEKTPHIHAIVVPLQEGRLTAKKVLGNRIEMSQRQDRYAKVMEDFSLSRGVKGSKAIHNSEGWYLGQQKQGQEAILSDLPKFSMLDRVNPSSYIENVSERLKTAQKRYVDKDIELKRIQQQLKANTKEIEYQQKQIAELNRLLKEEKKEKQEYFNNLWAVTKSHLGKPLTKEEKETVKVCVEVYTKVELEERQEQARKVAQEQKRGRQMGR